jgi:Tol biopolymer transport system component
VLSVGETGVVRVIANDAYAAAVSPDHQTIVYADGFGNLQAIPVVGGSPTYLGVSGIGAYLDSNATSAFSPDSTRIVIAYSDATFSQPIDAIVKLDGSGVTSLSGFTGWTVDWSPNGQTIAFAGTDTSGQPALATYNADGSGFTELVTGQRLAEPKFSPDSTKIGLLDAILLDPTDTSSATNEYAVYG